MSMWLVLQRIVAGIGRVLRRPWESRRNGRVLAAARTRARPPTADVRSRRWR